MFGFIKKLFGGKTEVNEVPYKVEAPVLGLPIPTAFPVVVNDQITDSVTQENVATATLEAVEPKKKTSAKKKAAPKQPKQVTTPKKVGRKPKSSPQA